MCSRETQLYQEAMETETQTWLVPLFPLNPKHKCPKRRGNVLTSSLGMMRSLVRLSSWHSHGVPWLTAAEPCHITECAQITNTPVSCQRQSISGAENVAFSFAASSKSSRTPAIKKKKKTESNAGVRITVRCYFPGPSGPEWWMRSRGNVRTQVSSDHLASMDFSSNICCCGFSS